jgi:hypothetical protein
VHGDLQSRIVSELGEPRWASYETLLCQDDGTLPGLADFWQDFKSLGRSLVLVAPEPFAPIARWLGARHVLVHPTAAFEHGAGAILDTVLDSQDTVYLTCAGPFAKVFATLHQNVLDVGSGFDPLVRGNTRAFQPDPEEVKQLFNFI